MGDAVVRHPLARDLVGLGLLTEDQLRHLAASTPNGDRPFVDLAFESGFIEPDRLLETLSARLHVPIVSLKDEPPTREALDVLPAEVARRHRCVPVRREGDRLTLACLNPTSPRLLDEVRFATGCRVVPVLARQQDLHAALEEHYDVTVEKMLEGLKRNGDEATAQEDYFIHDLQQKASEPTLVNLVNLIISEAIEEGASDIHIEPYEREMRVKYRVDGILQEVPPPPKAMQPAIVSRIKIMAGMDIAKRHIPQDGYIRINLARGQVDIRVATVPTIFGEGVVMRLLNKSAILIDLDDLGLDGQTRARFEPLLGRSYGIILVCGPTGSGKTTTLYAVLNRIQSPEKKIITIEDPVEYQLDGINQIPVRPTRGVTFASGLRSILRLDPDILLVGEVRDVETAEIAIRSALTGHLIFSTLHTNDASSAVTRLLDMGVEPYLIASSLQGVLAQRLVRRLCDRCRVPYDPPDELLAQFGKTREEARGGTFFKPAGCEHCKQRGYAGRIGIFELLDVDEELQHLIVRGESSHAIKAVAMKKMMSMREDGWQKIRSGTTTFAEVLRQTQRDRSENDAVTESWDE
ncbi:MAG: Flp pilus assembly complex ATPase component TadA [Candidatus Sumerlaeia bacterium]|nr:Flp pilus assembly complex ATPase component TadA [Candidatus Sumerlaeia bacterium]